MEGRRGLFLVVLVLCLAWMGLNLGSGVAPRAVPEDRGRAEAMPRPIPATASLARVVTEPSDPDPEDAEGLLSMQGRGQPGVVRWRTSKGPKTWVVGTERSLATFADGAYQGQVIATSLGGGRLRLRQDPVWAERERRAQDLETRARWWKQTYGELPPPSHFPAVEKKQGK